MIDLLLEPFGYQYMVKAIWVSALVGGVCAFLSCFLMLKGWSLMGDALAHAIVPGVALAYLLKVPYAAGAFFSGLLAALAMALVRVRTQLREDAVIGIVFTTFFAAGLLIVSINPTSVNVQSIVLGNILGISDEDVIQVAIIAAVSLVVLVARWRDLMLVSTHNLGSIPDFCDQVVIINKTVLAAGPTQTTFTHDNLQRAFGGALRHFRLGGADLHDDDDQRHVTVITDDERPLVLYGKQESETLAPGKTNGETADGGKAESGKDVAP